MKNSKKIKIIIIDNFLPEQEEKSVLIKQIKKIIFDYQNIKKLNAANFCEIKMNDDEEILLEKKEEGIFNLCFFKKIKDNNENKEEMIQKYLRLEAKEKKE